MTLEVFGMKLLSLGIHPDDADFGTGGFLVLLKEAGWETVILDLTEGERSTNGTVEERRAEAERSAEILGVSRRINCRLPDCGLDRSDVDQLACLVGYLREERPDLMLVPYWKDDHADHVEGSHMAERARYLAGLVNYLPGGGPFRVPTLLYYPCRRIFEPTFVVDVTSVYGTKERAVGCFESQIERAGREATQLNTPGFMERLRARALSFGGMVGAALGEAYLAADPLPLGAGGWRPWRSGGE